MTKFLIGAATAALARAPAALSAQALPTPTIAVVDSDQILRTCTQCVTANTALQAQLTQLEQRASALGTPLQTEGQAIDALLRALPQGQQPNAQLNQRIQAFQTQQQSAQTELQNRQQQIQRNVAFVRQQILQRLQPAVQQVMQQRNATIVLDRNAVLLHAPTVDVTPAVLAIVNQNSTPLNVNAPPPQQQAATPAPAQPQQPQRRPTGR